MAEHILDEESGIEYKKCIRCDLIKPINKYYKNYNQSADGLSSYCMDCSKEMSKIYKSQGSKKPRSTQLAKEQLESRGIPTHYGSGVGMPWVDLVAWGCVPIEAKASLKHQDRNFIFRFTPKQKKELLNKIFDGVLMLLCKGKERTRVFIIPANDKWLAKKMLQNAGNISVTLDSSHSNNKNWRYLRKFENAYYLIEQSRIKISNDMIDD